MNNTETRGAAFHEAGHVVVAWRNGRRVARAEIYPEKDHPCLPDNVGLEETKAYFEKPEVALGVTDWHPPDGNWDTEHVAEQVAIAGNRACQMAIDRGELPQLQNEYQIGNEDEENHLYEVFGDGEDDYDYDAISAVAISVHRILTDSWDQVQSIAVTLIEKHAIDAEAIYGIMESDTRPEISPGGD